jgi:hypothetical protein
MVTIKILKHIFVFSTEIFRVQISIPSIIELTIIIIIGTRPKP